MSLNIFAKGYLQEFKKLEEEKTELINRYEIRVQVARLDRMYKRVDVLTLTLHCLKNSRSKQEILQCKQKERKLIMQLIKG